MTAAPLLSYRDVVAGYAAPVVGPVSFDLRAGDVLALVGPTDSLSYRPLPRSDLSVDPGFLPVLRTFRLPAQL